MGGVGVDAVGMGFFLGGGVLVCWGMFITPLSLSLSLLIGKPSIKNPHKAVLPTHSRFSLVA